MTEAGKALAEDYPGLLGLEYGRTGEPIIDAIERESRASTLDEVLRGLRSEDDSVQLRAIIASVEQLRIKAHG